MYSPSGKVLWVFVPGELLDGLKIPLNPSVVNLNCDAIFIMLKASTQWGWLDYWLSLCVQVNLSHNKIKYVILVVQKKSMNIIKAIKLFNTTGQSLWRNKKISIVIKWSCLKWVLEKVFMISSALDISHTSLTLSKHNCHQLREYFVRPKPTWV